MINKSKSSFRNIYKIYEEEKRTHTSSSERDGEREAARERWRERDGEMRDGERERDGEMRASSSFHGEREIREFFFSLNK